MDLQIADPVQEPASWEPPRAPRLLHVLNGDATRWKLEQSELPGEVTVWADVLHEGPVPGEQTPPAEWREVRARYLAAAGHAAFDRALETSRRWDAALERHADYDEVVLWCEHDLFDQLLLIRHLAWFAGRDLSGARLSMVCIGSYPGVQGFRGLGQLAPEQLSALLPLREPVTRRHLELGRVAWRAFTSPDPTRIETLLAGDTDELPFLAPALLRHLQEFPSARNGLSRTQRQILELVRGGPIASINLFHALHEREDVFYIADGSLRLVLDDLSGGRAPLVDFERGERLRGWLPEGTLTLTPMGERVLAGGVDWIDLAGIDRWLGGVHLREGNVWRWDDTGRRLVR